jgi:hypothetical protein
MLDMEILYPRSSEYFLERAFMEIMLVGLIWMLMRINSGFLFILGIVSSVVDLICISMMPLWCINVKWIFQ